MKILLVDDSSFINLIAKKSLKDAGYNIVGEAYDGVKALELARSENPDIIVMDIALPKMNGLEASKKIMEEMPSTKILAMSALDEDWVKEQSLASGCMEFIKKPFHAKELVEAVGNLSGVQELRKHG